MSKVITESGAHYTTTGSGLLDFFSTAGSLLKGGTLPLFKEAWKTDKKKAMQLLFWLRDCRGGSGNRSGFKECLADLTKEAPEWVEANMDIVPSIGRWDDLTSLVGTPLEDKAMGAWANAIAEGDGLASKWAPRATNKTKKPIFDALRKKLKLSPKDFRQLLAKNTKVVENSMCQQKLDEVNYSHVPSVAMSRYRKSFSKKDGERFKTWLADVKKSQANGDGKVKMNASVLFPHDILRSMWEEFNNYTTRLPDNSWTSDFADTAFAALPDFIDNKDKRILTVVDCSGSMDMATVSGSVTALDVAQSLGLYCSARIAENNPFHKLLIPFSSTAKFFSWQGLPFSNAAVKLRQQNEAVSTNIQAVLQLILDMAQRYNMKNEDMPTSLLILTDMNFNQGVKCGEDTEFEAYAKKFAQAGYDFPAVIYWNLNSHGNTRMQAVAGTKNATMVSGFSAHIFKTVLTKGNVTPEDVMEKANEKYEPMVKIPA